MKLKLLVAAMTVAVAGNAAAAIAPGSSGNGELFLSVYDTVALTSYTRDLGIDMNTFLTNGSTAGYSLNYAADATLASAFTGFSTNANLLWNVAALDSTGGTIVGGQRYLSTTNASLATIKTTSNSKLTGGFSLVNDYVNAVNGVDVDSTTNNSSVHASVDGYSYFGNGFMNNWRGKASFNSTAAVGQSLGFFALQASSTSGLSGISATQFASADGNATWALGTNGTLSYNVPAPAAVPVPAAAWLFGSGLIGLVGVSRRKPA